MLINGMGTSEELSTPDLRVLMKRWLLRIGGLCSFKELSVSTHITEHSETDVQYLDEQIPNGLFNTMNRL